MPYRERPISTMRCHLRSWQGLRAACQYHRARARLLLGQRPQWLSMTANDRVERPAAVTVPRHASRPARTRCSTSRFSLFRHAVFDNQERNSYSHDDAADEDCPIDALVCHAEGRKYGTDNHDYGGPQVTRLPHVPGILERVPVECDDSHDIQLTAVAACHGFLDLRRA